MKKDIEIVDRIGFQTFDQLLREATSTVERELALEDAGWINLSGATGGVVTGAERIINLNLSRIYSAKDPLGKQSIRLWTDYTFGPGMSWSVDEDNKSTKDVLTVFWNSQANQPIFGARGQRKCSNKGLIDGEVFFALFLSKESTIRTINPLEITEIINDPDDKETPMYYKRDWSDAQGHSHTDYYRSWLNIKDKGTKDAGGTNRQKTEDAVIYHLALNTEEQRGNPLLLPALDWIKQYRRFLAARVGMMLARTRFANKLIVEGGPAAVAATKAALEGKTPEAGSTMVLNQAVKQEPIEPPQDAKNAYEDARILKLQVCAAVGIPEQYFGDIATGNLATAKTVELPMLKMFQSHQAVWADAFQDIFEIIFEYNKIPHYGKDNIDLWYVDKNFPAIAPEDIFAAAQAIVQIVTAFPDFASAPDVQQQALLALGINDPAQVIEQLTKAEESNVNVKLVKALREFRKVVEA